MDLATLETPEKIAAAGERIYARRKDEHEHGESARWAAVDVVGENVFTADSAHEAIEQGRAAAPTGVFHLIRIGFPTAFAHRRWTPGNQPGSPTTTGPQPAAHA